MNFLALDTTKLKSYIFLNANGKNTIKVLEETRKVSENLLVEVDNLLSKNGLNLNNIDVFGAVVGPGSFTGVRIGLATLKAFNNALNKKLVKVDSFEAFAETIQNGVLILSSTKTAVYYAKFATSKIIDRGVAEIDKLNEVFKGNKLYIIEENLKNIENTEFIDNYENLVLKEFERKINQKDFVLDQDFAPLYLQLSQAELNLKRKTDSGN